MGILLLKLALQNLLFFGLHFERKNNFPKQLSPKEEAECIKEIAAGSEQARDKLIIHNLRLVAYIVNKNYPDARDPDDLVSIGTIGLIRAVETFDFRKGNQFSTYASKCIDNSIAHFRKHLFADRIFQKVCGRHRILKLFSRCRADKNMRVFSVPLYAVDYLSHKIALFNDR